MTEANGRNGATFETLRDGMLALEKGPKVFPFNGRETVMKVLDAPSAAEALKGGTKEYTRRAVSFSGLDDQGNLEVVVQASHTPELVDTTQGGSTSNTVPETIRINLSGESAVGNNAVDVTSDSSHKAELGKHILALHALLQAALNSPAVAGGGIREMIK
ncbi:MAG: hypothetical protein WC924_01960 [Candidatus Gracilibacteria bacterium]